VRGARLRQRGDRGGVHHWAHTVRAAARRLEHVHGAGHVHLRARDRVRAHERHLESGEVDDRADAVLVDRALDLVEVGHVAVYTRERSEPLVVERQAEAMVADAEVVGHDVVAAVEQRADRPRPDGSQRPGHEVPHPSSSVAFTPR
jgi:hypothetical protein